MGFNSAFKGLNTFLKERLKEREDEEDDINT
jgi:hypothetical protein